MKGNITLLIILILFLTVIVIIDNRKEHFDISDMASRITVNLNNINTMISEDDTGDFLSKNDVAVDTAKDILHNVTKITAVQDGMYKDVLHNIFKLIFIIILLILVLVLIKKNPQFINGIFDFIFGLIKNIYNTISGWVKKNTSSIMSDLKKINPIQ